MQTRDAAEGLHKIQENTPKMLRENICSTYFFISGLTRQPLRDSRYVIALKIKMIKILPLTVKERETKRKVWLLFVLNQMWANWATLGN